MSEGRVRAVRALARKKGLKGLLVSSPTNVRYLSGFTGSSGALLITPRQAVLVTDFRYRSQAPQQAPHCKVELHRDGLMPHIAKAANRRRVQTLGIDEGHLTVAARDQLRRDFNGRLRKAGGLVEKVRVVKDEGELAILRRAVATADAAFEAILNQLRPGLTEREVAWEIEALMRRQGATGCSFDTIVASGPRSAMCHGIASDRKLRRGDLVTMDFGALQDGYCSDMTRTVCIGRATRRQQQIYGIVREAQVRAAEAVRAGSRGREVDAVARDVIGEAGFGDEFGHGLGHGVGMDIHEAPRLGERSKDELRPGMVVTVEPGIYIEDWGGVRIEDMVAVTDDEPEILTRSAKPERIIEI